MLRALSASIRHKGTMDSGAGGRPAGGLYGMFGAAAHSVPMGSSALDQVATYGGGGHAGGTSRTLDVVFVRTALYFGAQLTVCVDHGRHGLNGLLVRVHATLCGDAKHGSIASATKNIEMISEEIVRSEFLAEPGALRVGLISYRDHPPQDHVYIVRNFGFTADINHMKENLNSLFAAGGGDGPEAVTAALKAATELDWRPDAAKMAILIADAPPHGIGEYGDGFPNGSPDGEDPIVLARRMASMGISLFMVACEPALSGYQHAVDFYQGIVQVTSGMLVPLTTASLLSHVVVAAAGEVMDLDRLHREVGDAVLDRLRSLSLGASESAEAPPAPGAGSHLMDQVAMELHERLMLRNENTKQLIIESIYRESEESRHNVEVWANAADLFSARPYIRKVIGSRLSEKFLEMRRSGLSSHCGSGDTGGIGYRFESPSVPVHHTPSRQIVRDFSPFQARPGTSLHSGRERESSGSPARFTGYRAGDYRSAQSDMMDDDDDDDGMRNDAVPAPARSPAAEFSIAGENGQQLSYRQDTISLDQARRLAHQSLARRVL